MTDNAEWNAAIDAALTKVREQRAVFSSDAYATPQPIGGFMERFACNSIEVEIEALRKPDTPPTPAADEREAVARAVNPDVWASFDGSIRPYAENRGANASTDSAHFYERTWRAGCRTPDDVRRWWLETADAAKESTYVLLLRDSITKADAALSALAPIRAAEILAAEANVTARIVAWLRATSTGLDLTKRRIADAIERNEQGAGK